MDKLIFKDKSIKPLDIIIYSERLKLVAVNEKYVETMYREFDEEITKYMFPSPNENIASTLAFIDKSRKEMTSGNSLTFNFIDKESGEFLGNGGIHSERELANTPELGVWIKKSAHGNKYGCEAIHTLYYWACANLDFEYMIYPVARANTSSRKIPEFLGGVIFKEEITKKANGEDMDTVFYKIDKMI